MSQIWDMILRRSIKKVIIEKIQAHLYEVVAEWEQCMEDRRLPQEKKDFEAQYYKGKIAAYKDVIQIIRKMER